MSNRIQEEYERLPEEVKWALQRADGFIDLRMGARAHAALDEIPDAYRQGLSFRLHHLRLAMEEEEWKQARALATGLKEDLPDQPFLWIQLAYATRRSASLVEAEAILDQALGAFPDDALIPYNLSCYACCQGHLDRAREHLRIAIARESVFREMALEDTDLEPLWDEVEKL